LTDIARWNRLDPKTFARQYKDHLSEFHTWDQKDHANEWLVFKDNVGERLGVDETSVSNGELYTVLTNKVAKGGKGSLVAMVEGTKAADISIVFNKIPLSRRLDVKEVTLDFSQSMERAVVISFPNARLVTDRFHVQKLVSEALQEIRVHLRHKAIEEENKRTAKARQHARCYTVKTYANGDTKNNSLPEVGIYFSLLLPNGLTAKHNGRLFCLNCFPSSSVPTNSPCAFEECMKRPRLASKHNVGSITGFKRLMTHPSIRLKQQPSICKTI